MVAINSDYQQDILDLIELTTRLKTESIKTVMEEALVKVFCQIDSNEFAKTVILLSDSQSRISYLTTLYIKSQKSEKPLYSARDGVFISG